MAGAGRRELIVVFCWFFFCTFVRFALVWFVFPLPRGVWDGLRPVIMALPELFSYLFFSLRGIVRLYSANVASFLQDW